MEDKLIEFLKEYIEDVDGKVEQVGKRTIIIEGLKFLINEGVFSIDGLRKEVSIYVKRIISISEFEKLLRGEEQWISQD